MQEHHSSFIAEVSPVSAPVVRLRIEQVQPGETVRLGQVNWAYVDVLAELIGEWPPLLVTRTRRIVDGHYRYLAARRLGRTHVDCVMFDGDDADAFVESVRRNVTHGLPLTLKERKRAASRILQLQPKWSDRKIGRLCGLAHETVGRLRQPAPCQGGEIRHLDSRRGSQSGSRTKAASDTRTRIVDAIEANPGASLRQLARTTDSSHETVRAVRRRLQNGSSDIPLASPSADAAFTSTDAGTSFAKWFEQTSISPECVDYVEDVPLSRIYEIADEARNRAFAWTEFADALTSRSKRSSG